MPAYAKINLGLRILGRRPDGYHELRTVFQTISLHDTLAFDTNARRLRLEGGTPEVPPSEDNLVLRAARAFAREIGREPRVRITLKKRIPSRAGLGGGSSDAAVTLLALNRIHGFPLDRGRLSALASGLGSDVPFFLSGGTALGLGRGEIVRPLRDLEPRPIVVAVPDHGVSTAEAFGMVAGTLTPGRGQISIYRFSRQWVRRTRGFAPNHNDFERVVARRGSRLAGILDTMRASGATAVAMTGSGSGVYGFFAGRGKAVMALGRLRVGFSKGSRAWLVRTIGAAEYAVRVLEPGGRHSGS